MVIMLFICSQGNIVNAETVKIDTNRFKTVVIEKGKSAKLCNLSMKKIKWKSTNKKVATVNKKGLVKAKKIGLTYYLIQALHNLYYLLQP